MFLNDLKTEQILKLIFNRYLLIKNRYYKFLVNLNPMYSADFHI